VLTPPLQCSAKCRVLTGTGGVADVFVMQNIKAARVKKKRSLSFLFHQLYILPVLSLSFSTSVAVSQGRGQLSSSIFSARSMFMRCPTRVTPSSAKSSLVNAGR